MSFKVQHKVNLGQSNNFSCKGKNFTPMVIDTSNYQKNNPPH
jgi:hypothetical protein